MATMVLPFMANYSRELRIGADIRRKEKVKNKRQADRGQREVEKWKKGNKVILSIKDLVFKERPVKKLTERYVGLYEIEKVVLKNVVKLKLPALMRIHLVVNFSRIKRYRELVRGQRVKELKPVEVDGVEEWEVEKILNKRKVQGVDKYLVRWKGFTAENDIWKREKNLENAKELVDEFEGRLEAEVR